MSPDELERRYHCDWGTIRRWSDECGVDYKGRLRPPSPPEGFREAAPNHTQAELRRMYGSSGQTVNRWARELGVTLKRVRPQYQNRDTAAEIALCLTCPFSKCRPTKCRRVRAV